MNILIVDDDIEDIEAAKKTLQHRYSDAAFNYITESKQILKYLEQTLDEWSVKDEHDDEVHTPDLIFLDLYMPLINGKDILKIIKKVPEFADIPVVMLTGNNDMSSIEACLEMGAISYIIKPINNEKMGAVVNRLNEHLLNEIDNKLQ